VDAEAAAGGAGRPGPGESATVPDHLSAPGSGAGVRPDVRRAEGGFAAGLRHELRGLGLQWTVRENGRAELAGVPHWVLRAFSRRRVEIEAAIVERRVTGRTGGQVATLAARDAKEYGVRSESLAAQWHAHADALGFDARARAALLHHVTPEPAHAAKLVRAAGELLSTDGLTARMSTFTRPGAIRGWCVRLAHGAPAEKVEAPADRLLASPGVVPLDRRETMASSTGRYAVAWGATRVGTRPRRCWPPRSGRSRYRARRPSCGSCRPRPVRGTAVGGATIAYVR
jgi:hypothetical protein